VIRRLLATSHDAPTCLNVNFPDCDASAAGPLTVTRRGIGLVEGIEFVPEVDPRGIDYFWLRFQRGPRKNAPDSETAVVASKRISSDAAALRPHRLAHLRDTSGRLARKQALGRERPKRTTRILR
jgi:broad specificity polyphosphatase/5'/3'-nucleotidase SurE